MKSRPIRRNSLSGFRTECPFVPKAQLATTSVVNLAHRSLPSNSPVERAKKKDVISCKIVWQDSGIVSIGSFFSILLEAVAAVVRFVIRYLC